MSRQIGPWVLERSLGQGALEARARARGPAGRVELEFPLREAEESRAAFAHAARLCALDGGAATLELVDQRADPPGPWLAFAPVPCAALDTLLARGRAEGGAPPAGIPAALLGATARALAALHALEDPRGPVGFVHAALDPRVLLVGFDGRVRIRGLYLAHSRLRERPLGRGRLPPAFTLMSPELIRGLRLTDRSDLFSLALILYRFLSGRDPLQADTDFETLENVRLAQVPPLDHPLWPLLARCLGRDPAARPSAAALAAELPPRPDELGAWAASLAGAPGPGEVDDEMIFGPPAEPD